ncbi:helix-turn-helix domain-containing protein [Azospirillum argentinense]|uniref:HTH cro/C1-type domain-containing protein n=1 Tax=Azospirillum argentinense TaxID=2970906 RepID=A0A5B0L2X5_9PROT|nr:helix-turn-helix transcriptional regulator [Azospirillum argentinense]KAA1058699.1 helix-turn-helix transcriptional regulator [Azospirillum argentinense]
MKEMQQFGKMLRELREQRGLTQEDLAGLIERSVQAISAMERGQNMPRLETLIRISEKLDIPLCDIVKIFDARNENNQEKTLLEITIVDAARHLSLRDLKVVSNIIKSFPKEK